MLLIMDLFDRGWRYGYTVSGPAVGNLGAQYRFLYQRSHTAQRALSVSKGGFLLDQELRSPILARRRSVSDLKTQFETAAQEVQKLPKRPDDKTLLTLYAFYKQATVGDVTGARPGGFDMVGKAKYDAWAKLKGTSQEMAMQAYIEVVRRLKG